MTEKLAPDMGGAGPSPASPSMAAPSGAPRPASARRLHADSQSAAADLAARESPHADFLLKLFRAMKGAQFYPENHPAFVAMLEKCHSALVPLLGEGRPLVFEIRSQRVHRDGKPVGGDIHELRNIAMQCTYRRVKKFHLQEGAQPQELAGFIRALVTDPPTVLAAGGVEKVLFAREVRNIWANEINYQDLLYGDQSPVPAEELCAPEEALEPGDPLEEAPLLLPPDATPALQDLVKRLEELDAATDAARYAALAPISCVTSQDHPRLRTETCTARAGSIHARRDRDRSSRCDQSCKGLPPM
jgi:hypothetical protein